MKRKVSLDFSSQDNYGRLIFVVVTNEPKPICFEKLKNYLSKLSHQIAGLDPDNCYRNFRIKHKSRRFELKVIYHLQSNDSLKQCAQQNAIDLVTELEKILEH